MVERSPDQHLGKYQILEELGRGGFATVYLARDRTLEREVALKILHPHLLNDPSFVERFQREARTLAGLRHPHIVTVHEVSESEGQLFIAMELARGPSLAQALESQERFSWQETMEILRPVCDALDYAHVQGVAHRDLKPANVLLDRERGPLLTDFGFARLMSSHSASLSLSGGVVGTPSYIAPEVWDSDVGGPAADIYALGCIVHEMVTGGVLFRGNTPMQVMRAHDRGPQFPEAWPEGTPSGVANVLSTALAPEPSSRYSEAGGLWRALNDLKVAADETWTQAAVRHPSAQVSLPEPASARMPKWTWAVGAVVAVVVLVLLGIGVLVMAYVTRGVSQRTPVALASQTVTAVQEPISTVTTQPPTASPVPPTTAGAAAPTVANTPVPPTHTPLPPVPSPTPLPPTGTPVSTATPTSPPASATVYPTYTPYPTHTPALPASTPTHTPVPPTATPQPTATASPPIPGATATSLRVVAGELILLKPAPPDESDNLVTTNGLALFEWQYGGSLRADQGFEVRVWRDGEPQAGAHDAVEDNKGGKVVALGNGTYRLEIDISQATGVGGRTGEYLWTVLLVQIDPGYNDLGIQAPPGRLRFEAPGGEDGDGDGGGKPTF